MSLLKNEQEPETVHRIVALSLLEKVGAAIGEKESKGDLAAVRPSLAKHVWFRRRCCLT